MSDICKLITNKKIKSEFLVCAAAILNGPTIFLSGASVGLAYMGYKSLGVDVFAFQWFSFSAGAAGMALYSAAHFIDYRLQEYRRRAYQRSREGGRLIPALFAVIVTSMVAAA